jgi:signal transduction histidine kinase
MKQPPDPGLIDAFEYHQLEANARNLNLIMGLGLLILLYFSWLDLHMVGSRLTLYPRLLPLTLGTLLLALNLWDQSRWLRFKFVGYNLFLCSLMVMMYAKCLIHMGDEWFSVNVTGLILVIFLVSVDIKTRLTDTLLIYLLPALLFVLAVLLSFEPDEEQVTQLTNAAPMLLLGFVVNRIQNRFRFNLFRSNHLLEKEKWRAERLARESRAANQELLSLNRQLQASETGLKQAIRTKDKLFSIIAHDLRGPFSSLLGYTEMLAETDPEQNPGQVRDFSVAIRQASEKLFALTSNLLNWSRSQLGDIRPRAEPLPVADIVEEAASLFVMQAQSKGIRLRVETEEGLQVMGDQETLSVVIRNLLSNAIKYTGTGGEVGVQAGRQGQRVVIRVTDTGMGMNRQELNRLFRLEDSFSKNGTENEPGTGLGLILCKEFTELNGGTITADSQAGRGSVFTLNLPAAG